MAICALSSLVDRPPSRPASPLRALIDPTPTVHPLVRPRSLSGGVWSFECRSQTRSDSRNPLILRYTVALALPHVPWSAPLANQPRTFQRLRCSTKLSARLRCRLSVPAVGTDTAGRGERPARSPPRVGRPPNRPGPGLLPSREDTCRTDAAAPLCQTINTGAAGLAPGRPVLEDAASGCPVRVQWQKPATGFCHSRAGGVAPRFTVSGPGRRACAPSGDPENREHNTQASGLQGGYT